VALLQYNFGSLKIANLTNMNIRKVILLSAVRHVAQAFCKNMSNCIFLQLSSHQFGHQAWSKCSFNNFHGYNYMLSISPESSTFF